MRLTIIPADSFVSVNGEGFNDLDLSFMAADIHAVQWYETDGEIERKDSRGRIIANEPITSIEQFQQVLDVWQQARELALQKEAEEFKLLGDMNADDLAVNNAEQ
jgi:hypothetical protein